MVNDENNISQDDRVLAGLAHGSILLGALTNGIGGVGAALVIWITQKERSPYAARQALQALIYQVVTFTLTFLLFGCWGILWTVMTLVPLALDANAYNAAPPPTMWVGLSTLACPFALWALTILYGLWGGFQCLRGKDFQYAVIGRWLAARDEKQEA